MNKKHRACDGSAILPQHEEAGCFYLNYCWILFQQNDKLWSRQESCGARSCIHRTRRIALRRQQWTDGVTCLRSASVNFRPHSAAARRQLKENVADRTSMAVCDSQLRNVAFEMSPDSRLWRNTWARWGEIGRKNRLPRAWVKCYSKHEKLHQKVRNNMFISIVYSCTQRRKSWRYLATERIMR